MSVFVNEKKEFVPFFGTTIMSEIKNSDDFLPLLKELNNIKHIKIVKNLNLKIYDVFSQTLASFTGETCPKIEKWLKERGMSHYPYKPLDYDVVLEDHYTAKNIINMLFPQNFNIKINKRIEINNNKIILKFDFDINTKIIMKKIIKSLNDLYENKKGLNNQIVLGYIYKEHCSLSTQKIQELTSLIPENIFVNNPDVYHYKNVDNYCLYSCKMY